MEWAEVTRIAILHLFSFLFPFVFSAGVLACLRIFVCLSLSIYILLIFKDLEK